MAKTLTSDSGDITRVALPIEKWEEDKEGNLLVFGKATDASLDSDRQSVDVDWSAKALQSWHETGGNIRVQHNPALYPAGKSVGLEVTPDGHWVKGLVVEPTAISLVKHGILRAFSIGVADPVIERDPTRKAPGGVIRAGRIVELSLVDRPANSNCYLTLAKSADHDRDWSHGDLQALLAAAENDDPTDEAAKMDTPDTDKDPDTGAGGDGDDIDGSGDSHGDPDDDTTKTTDADAVKAATAGDRAAYLAACKDWQDREPTGQAETGTEHLQQIAAWKKWAGEGETEGLNGTEDGAARWLAKNATGSALSDEALDATAQAETVKLAQNDPLEPADLGKREFSAEQRRQYAKEGKALADGSYPIPDADALRRAAVLARSGHGNAAAAKRLISRRAKELGVANPLEDGGSSKTAKPSNDDSDDAPKCKTCKGSGKIRGGSVKCPDCKGSGKAGASKGDEPAVAQDAAVATVRKAVELGLITEDAAKQIIAELTGAETPDTGKGAPMPDGVQPAAPHREPDGTTTVEPFEHDAGMATDPDPDPDKVPASVKTEDADTAKADDSTEPETEVPYAVKRMHDALCAAYAEADVLAAYPSLTRAADAIDPAWFETETIAVAARAVKDADPDVVKDARALLHKAFSDMYPNTTVRPQDRVAPGTYHRPYLSSGHAAEHASGTPAASPPAKHVPEPQQFSRGNLTAGHQAASPADHGPNNPHPPDAGGRSYYSTAEQEMTSAAMRSVHDHVAGQFAGTCPMAPARTVMPAGMDATSVPTSSPGFPQAGGFADGSRKADEPATPAPAQRKGENMLPDGKTLDQVLLEASEAGARAALKALAANTADPAAITTLVAEQVRGLRDQFGTELQALRKQYDELAQQPDPNMSPVRGQLTRAGGQAPATAVQKRNLVDEVNDARRAAQAAEQQDFMEYLHLQATSGDPKVREKAMAVLDKMAGTTLPA